MSRQTLRIYIAVWALLALVIAGLATNRAGVWGGGGSTDPEVAAVVRQEQAQRAALARAQVVVNHRWTSYQEALIRRRKRIAAAERAYQRRLAERRRQIAARQREIARLRRLAQARL